MILKILLNSSPTIKEENLTAPLQGVSEKTRPVLMVLMQYEELQSYNLVGGTGLAIHLQHRLSEDIDLFSYNPSYPGKKFQLPNRTNILERIKNDFPNIKYDYNDKYDVTLYANQVKIQFRAEHQFHRPKLPVTKLGHINLPSLKDLLGMKIVALCLRNQWRDIYDLTCLAKQFDLTAFYPAYEQIMSTNYCGTKASKAALFDSAIAKLKSLELIQSLHRKDSMGHLITDIHITPDDVVKVFQNLKPKSR